MKCPSCECEVHPMQELTASGGIMNKCPRAECGVALPATKKIVLAEPPPTLAPVVQLVGESILTEGTTVITNPLEPFDDDPLTEVDAATILELAKTRLEWIECRMGELSCLKVEHEMLKRMIYAAKTKRRRKVT